MVFWHILCHLHEKTVQKGAKSIKSRFSLFAQKREIVQKAHFYIQMLVNRPIPQLFELGPLLAEY